MVLSPEGLNATVRSLTPEWQEIEDRDPRGTLKQKAHKHIILTSNVGTILGGSSSGDSRSPGHNRGELSIQESNLSPNQDDHDRHRIVIQNALDSNLGGPEPEP